MGLMTTTHWRDRGRCRGVDPDVFYPEEDDAESETAAKAVCEHCPVREPCLEHAITRREKIGIWGGLTAIERRRLIRRRRRAS